MERSEAAPNRAPRVRLVILNWNNLADTSRAVGHLLDLDWPQQSLDIVVVDNASTDGDAQALRDQFPQIDVRELETNVGFTGNNAALDDLDDIDFVGLVNNDAFCTPDYLRPLVEALEADPGLGAVCPKIVLEAKFVGFRIEVVTGDSEPIQIEAVRASSIPAAAWNDIPVEAESGFDDITARCHIAAARETRMATEGGATWFELDGTAILWVPALGEDNLGSGNTGYDKNTVTLTVSGPPGSSIQVTPLGITGDPAGAPTTAQLGPDGRADLDAVSVEPPTDVIQNIGTEMVARGYGRDRGYLEADTGQYDKRAEVFAWCGAGVLFRPSYLRDVGLFDERFFLYYEDLDLSWRGRAQGWRYRTVPTSVMRHAHASSTVQGSPSFTRYQVRNRLIVVAKNGSPAMAARTVARSSGRTVLDAIGAIAGSTEERTQLANRVRAQAEALKMAPGLWRERRSLAAKRKASGADVEALISDN